MKLLTITGRLMFAAMLVAGLGACSKKKNGSVVAATPASLCTPTAQGTYINTLGQPCSPTANQCVFNGTSYVVPGTAQACAPQSQCVQNQFGQYTNNLGQACTPYQQVPNYPGQYQGQQQQYGCNSYTYQYGIQYVPVYLQGGLQCVRIDLLQNNQTASYPPSYYQSGYYESGYDYYYAYPPYERQAGYGCGIQVGLDLGFGGVQLCF